MPLISWPPVVQRFCRGKTWWGVISQTPAQVFRYGFSRQPIVGWVSLYCVYQYFWVGHWQLVKDQRMERWKRNYRADLHMQENDDWKTKDARDGLKQFLADQAVKYGSFEKAAQAFAEKNGMQMPTFVVGDAVLDSTLKRVGVPVPGAEEPEFLWDGTPYTTKKPVTTPDGKRLLPQPPKYYI